MQAFVITLREGVEAALIIALVLMFLNRSGRRELNRWVYAGLGLAIVASLLGAVGFSMIGFDPEDALVEGVMYAVAAVLVVSLVVWMWRSSKGMKQQIEGRLETITTAESRRYGWGLLTFVFFMIFREGVETVLFLAALSLTETSEMVSLVGGIVGLILAALFGVLFIRGSLRINLRLFFAVTGFVLLVLAARLAAGSLHEFYEAGVISLSHTVEEIIEFLTSESTSTIVLIVLVAIPLIAMLPERWLRPILGRASQKA